MRKAALAVGLCMALIASHRAGAQTIYTVAGGGPTNIDATSVALGNLTKVVGARNGDIYFAVPVRSQVLRLSAGGTLHLVAGTGSASYWGDGVPAQNAALYSPTGIALDAASNLFIADTVNHVIRRVDATTGVITTIAGTPGSAGSSGDGGAALSAKLRTPSYLAVDGMGRIYFSDTGNNRVRLLTPSGGSYTISHYAGLAAGTAGTGCENCAAATSALSGPLGVAVDAAGNLLIADTGNHLIRRVDVISQCVATVAGIAPGANGGYSGSGLRATTSKLNYPVDVTLDPQGNFYIAEQANHLIRYVSYSNANPVERLMTDFAGVAQSGGYNGDGVAAAHQLQTPYGVGWDWSGRVLVGDTNNNRVRAITIASAGVGGTITTLGGNGGTTTDYFGEGASGLSLPLISPRGVAVDSDGAVYISESNVGRVRKLAADGTQVAYAGNGQSGITDGPATSSPLSLYLRGMATDSSKNLYIADIFNGVLRRVDAVTKNLTTVSFSGAIYQVAPYGLAYIASANKFYISDNINCVVWLADPVAQTATVYAGQLGKCQYSGDGGLATSATLGSLTYNTGVYGVAVDGSGALYIADPYQSVVRRVDPVTHIITRFAGDGTGIGGRSGDGGPATSAKLNGPWGLAADSLGNVYIADFLNHSIRKVDTGGTITTFAGDGTAGFNGDGGLASAARLYLPTFLSIDGAGRLVVADSGNGRIRVIETCSFTLSASSTTLASGSGSVDVTAPAGCWWSATTSAPWLNGLPSGKSGSGTVNFSLLGASGSARSATISAAGQSFTVTQPAASCTVGFNPSASGTIGAAGGNSSIDVVTGGYDCNWTVSTPTAWITRLPSAGVGSAEVPFAVAANLNTNARTGTIVVGGQTYTLTQAGTGCTVDLSPISPVSAGGSGGTLSVTVTTSSPTCAWTATTGTSWITNISPASGTGSQSVTFFVAPNAGSARSGALSVLGQTYTINQAAGAADLTAPFGNLDTPTDGAVNLAGAFAVTGWALDNVGVTKVEIYREPVNGEPGGRFGWVYIGDGNFVLGSRPDVAAAYASYPNNRRGGWGYQLLSNMLPNSGNVTVTLHAVAYDAAGNSVVIGPSKTVTCNNAAATKPFGSLATPAQGGTASGRSFVNHGWALTPGSATIPTNGCSIKVMIDGAPIGCPIYSDYRSDVAALFPGYTNAAGAGGHFFLDTTQFADGVHTISWSVWDDQSRAQGVGSRFFTIANNLSTLTVLPGRSLMSLTSSRVRSTQTAGALTPVKIPAGQLFVRRNAIDAPLEELLAGEDGRFVVTAEHYERIELHLGAVSDGYQMAGSLVDELPAGSTLDPDTGVFYWDIAAPYLGEYELRFRRDDGHDDIRVLVRVIPQQFTAPAAQQ